MSGSQDNQNREKRQMHTQRETYIDAQVTHTQARTVCNTTRTIGTRVEASTKHVR
eukprot:EC813867.1.p4 GENE.EC813867.1~~EC813867.1.p4  ORF type:complete len:55 (+),score=2.61 EC813867.1:410-574(+)